jgi:ATP-dependent DNA helicase RecG
LTAHYYKINELQNNIAEVQIIGKIINIKTVEFGETKTIGGDFVDDTGQMELVWFQGHKWIRESLKLNEMCSFPEMHAFGSTFNMAHPEIELLNTNKVCVQRCNRLSFDRNLNESRISNRVINKLMQQLFLETQALFTETLPDYLLQELKLIPRSSVIQHSFPTSAEVLATKFRLIFEELFFYSVAINHEQDSETQIKDIHLQRGQNRFFQHHLPFVTKGEIRT